MQTLYVDRPWFPASHVLDRLQDNRDAMGTVFWDHVSSNAIDIVSRELTQPEDDDVGIKIDITMFHGAIKLVSIESVLNSLQ